MPTTGSEATEPDWGQLVDFYEEEARLAESPRRASRLLLEVGRIWEEHLDRPDMARAAYRRARDADTHDPAPERALRLLPGVEPVVTTIDPMRSLLETALDQTTGDLDSQLILRALGDIEPVSTPPPTPRTPALDAADGLGPAAPVETPEGIAARLSQLQQQRDRATEPGARAALEVELGVLYERALARHEEALSCYRAALEAMPTHPLALYGVVELEAIAEQWEAVDDLIDTVEAVDTDLALRLRYLAVLIARAPMGDPTRGGTEAKSARRLEQVVHHIDAVAEGTRDGATLLEIADAYEQLGRWDQANNVLGRLIELVPGPLAAAAWHRIGLNLETNPPHGSRGAESTDRASHSRGDGDGVDSGGQQHSVTPADRAADAHQRALTHQSNHLPALSALRRLLWRRPIGADYLRIVDALTTLPDVPRARGALLEHAANVAESVGADREAAISRWEAALAAQAQGPQSGGDDGPLSLPSSLYALLRLRGPIGEWDRLVASLSEFAELDLCPTARLRVLDWLACIYEARLERLDSAIEANRRILELAPNHPRALRALERLQGLVGNPDGVIAAAEQALDGLVHVPWRLAVLTRLAELQSGLGRAEACEQTWRQALNLDPCYLPALVGLGRLLHGQARWEHLAALQQQVLAALPPDDGERTTVLGRLAEIYEFRTGDLERATETYEEVLKRMPSAPDALSGLERVYAQQEQWLELVHILRAQADSVGQDADRGFLLFRAAEIEHGRLGRARQAAQLYGAAFAADRRLLPAAWSLEFLAWHAGDRATLVELYSTLLTELNTPAPQAIVAHKLAFLLSDDSVQALWSETPPAILDASAAWNLARIAVSADDMQSYAQALSQIAECVEGRLEQTALRLEVAEVSMAMPLVDRATRRSHWERLVEIDPRSDRAWEALCALEDEQAPADSRARLLTRLATAAEDPRARSSATWRAGLLFAEAGHAEPARKLYREAAKACPIDPVPAWLELDLRDRSGRPVLTGTDRAELLQASAGRLSNGPVSARQLTEAGALWEGVHAERSLICNLRAVERDPKADTPARRAEAVLRQGKYWTELRAMLALRAERIGEPARAKALLEQLAELELGRLGDTEAARRTLGRLIELAPDDLERRITLAELCQKEHAHTEAAQHLEHAASLATGRAQRVDLYLRLGTTLADQVGDAAAAIIALRQAVGLIDESGQAVEALADVCLRSGDHDSAYVAYRQVERLVDEPDRARRARAGQLRALVGQRQTDTVADHVRGWSQRGLLDAELLEVAKSLLPNHDEVLSSVNGGRPSADNDPRMGDGPATGGRAPGRSAPDSLAAVEAYREEGRYGVGKPSPSVAPERGRPGYDAPPFPGRPLYDEPFDDSASTPAVNRSPDSRLSGSAPAAWAEHALTREMPSRMAGELSRAGGPEPPVPADPRSDGRSPISAMPHGPASRYGDPSSAPWSGAGAGVGAGAPGGRALSPESSPPRADPGAPVSGRIAGPPPIPQPPRGLRNPPPPSGRAGVRCPPPIPSMDAPDRVAAIDQARKRIQANLMDGQAWQLLRDALPSEAEGSRSWLGEIIAWLDGGITPARTIQRPGPIPEQLLVPLLPPTAPKPLLNLLRTVAPELAALVSRGARAHGINESDILPEYDAVVTVARRAATLLRPSSVPSMLPDGTESRGRVARWLSRRSDPLATSSARLARMVPVQPFAVLRHPRQPAGVVVEGGETAALLLGDTVLRADAGGSSFVAGWGLVHLTEGSLPAQNLNRQEFAALLVALFAHLGVELATSEADRGAVDRHRARVDGALPPGWRGLGASMARAAVAGLESNSIAAARAGLVLYSARLALSLAFGFGGAFEMLRQQELGNAARPEHDRAGVREFLRESPLARELLRFAGSQDCLVLRNWLWGNV